MTLWSSRFTGTLDPSAWALNTSLPFDQRLALQDVRGSIAWAGALEKVDVLTRKEYQQIVNGLNTIEKEFVENKFIFVESDEDIHTAVERRLGELIGAAAGKLHTGRSRNDQVATDFRLWILESLPLLDNAIKEFQFVLLNLAETHQTTLMPGYTHPICDIFPLAAQPLLAPATRPRTIARLTRSRCYLSAGKWRAGRNSVPNRSRIIGADSRL